MYRCCCERVVLTGRHWGSWRQGEHGSWRKVVKRRGSWAAACVFPSNICELVYFTATKSEDTYEESVMASSRSVFVLHALVVAAEADFGKQGKKGQDKDAHCVCVCGFSTPAS